MPRAASRQLTVVVGCGRVGSRLANELSRTGQRVVVIDKDEKKFDNLDIEFSGFRIVGDAVEQAVLRQAQTDKAQALVTVTASDNVNLMLAQAARTVFKVPLVVARVHVAEREALYRELGITTVNPSILAADAFLRALTNSSPK